MYYIKIEVLYELNMRKLYKLKFFFFKLFHLNKLSLTIKMVRIHKLYNIYTKIILLTQVKLLISTTIYYLFIYFETLNNVLCKNVYIKNIIVYNNLQFIYYLKDMLLENYEILISHLKYQ